MDQRSSISEGPQPTKSEQATNNNQQPICDSTVGAMGLARRRGKMRFIWIDITWEPGLLLSCSFFSKLTDTFTYTVRNFKPCSLNGFVCRSVNVTVIFCQRIFVVFHEFCGENLKIRKFSWKYLKTNVFATEWWEKSLEKIFFFAHLVNFQNHKLSSTRTSIAFIEYLTSKISKYFFWNT